MNAGTFRRLLALILLAASLSAASALECGSFQVLRPTSYDAFGVLIDRTGTTDNSFLYCGERWDANLGFYYLRARYMNPGTGRFWTMDEWEGVKTDPKTLHVYLYSASSPVVHCDPSGNGIEFWMAKAKLLDARMWKTFAKIFAKFGVQAGLAMLVGIAAHRKLGEVYRGDHSLNPHIFTNQPLFAIVGYSPVDASYLRLRPDIADGRSGEVYEIKSFISAALGAGVGQLTEYIDLLNWVRPEPISGVTPEAGPWHAGTTWDPENFAGYALNYGYVPPGIRIHAWRSGPGMIVYAPSMEYYFWAVGLEAVYQGTRAAAFQMARLESHVAGGMIFALAGVL